MRTRIEPPAKPFFLFRVHWVLPLFAGLVLGFFFIRALDGFDQEKREHDARQEEIEVQLAGISRGRLNTDNFARGLGVMTRAETEQAFARERQKILLPYGVGIGLCLIYSVLCWRFGQTLREGEQGKPLARRRK